MKKVIPTHDPQTGELNPYYEELTGEKNPLEIQDKKDRLDIFKEMLINLSENDPNLKNKLTELEVIIERIKNDLWICWKSIGGTRVPLILNIKSGL